VNSVEKEESNITKSTPAPRRGWGQVQVSFYILGIAVLCNVFIGSLLYLLAVLNLPDVATLSSYQPSEASLVVDAKGRELTRFYRENRRVVKLSDMPSLLPKAFVAAEDGRFYQHGGVDGWSVLRAVFNNFRSGRRAQGGSTITQQVARAILLSPEKTYIRKLREAVLACRIDRVLSKNEVLHLYLNQIYFGEGAYGVEAASQVYFGKKVGLLTLAEMSILAGLPQAPSRYSPLVDFKSAKARQRYVLNRMAEDGYISADQARAAYGQELILNQGDAEGAAEGYFLETVRQYVESRCGTEQLLTGGLTIRITMDRELQKAAALAVTGGVAAWRERHPQATAFPQAALVALEVDTGRVLALAGGRDFGESEFNRAIQSRRQPGSVFKPFIYAVALNGAFSPTSLIDDKPISLPGGASGVWQPSNYDGKFLGPITLRTGLIQSRNIVTIKLLQAVGVEPVIKLAGEMGITSPLENNLSLALGTSGVSLLELTNAYGVFADGGFYHKPVLVEQIVDRKGRIIESSVKEKRRVLPARTAYQVTNLLQGVIKEGTGHQADGLEGESAGKTGTTDKSTDAWFVGYTPDLVAGVWLGFDRQEHLGEVESGGKLAAPVWLNFMQETRRLRPASILKFPVPEDVVLMATEAQGDKRGEGAGGASGLLTAFGRPQLPDGGKPGFFKNLWDKLQGK